MHETLNGKSWLRCIVDHTQQGKYRAADRTNNHYKVTNIIVYHAGLFLAWRQWLMEKYQCDYSGDVCSKQETGKIEQLWYGCF